MSYEPLHHKYRPQTFADLVGQEAIATTLTHAIALAKIAPAYLFTGPRGTGKTSSARILAKSLNCLSSEVPTDKPCGVCNVCRGIANGSTLDVIEIDAASNTGVDNIREIIERAQFAPVQCRYKVFAIDECHMLSTAAFNALLKTLEEPPDRVVFVLATTDPQRVLPTIISRCQRFDFRRIPLAAMVSHLSAIASKENININSEALTLVAQIAQGGLRDAESLLDQLSLLSGQVTVERVWDLVGSCSEPDLLALLQAIAQNNPETILDCARSIMDRGREPLVVLQNLAGFYRDLLVAKTAPNRSDLVALTPSTWTQLCETAKSWDIATILQGQQHLKNSEVQIKNTTQPRLWLEVTMLGLLPTVKKAGGATAAASWAGGEEETTLKKSLPSHSSPPPPSPLIPKGDAEFPTREPAFSPAQEAASPAQEAASPAPPAPEIAPPAQDPATTNSPAEIWQQVLANLQPISTRELLRQMGHLIQFDGNSARIGIKSQALCKKAQANLPNITAAFQATFKRAVRVSIELATTPNKPSPATDLPKPVATTPVSFSQEAKTVTNYQGANSSSAAPPRPEFQSGREIDRPAFSPASPSPNSEIETYAAVSRAQLTRTDASPEAFSPEVSRPNVVEQTHNTIPTPVAQWDDDEAAIAAQRLADFFNGEVVRLDPDSVPTATNHLSSAATNTAYLGDTDTQSDDDSDF